MRKFTIEQTLLVLDILQEASERTAEACANLEEFQGAVKARGIILDILDAQAERAQVEATR